MIKAVDLIIIAFGLLVVVSIFLAKKEQPNSSFSSRTMNCVKGVLP